MKSDFVQPRFEGHRFAENTLPLDVTKDLAAYETLLVELAKHLYLKEHLERQRVPKGFAADFHLHLERIDAGSARPMLSLVTAGALALSGGGSDYFERARDLIAQCIAAPDGQLPTDFPRELLAHFNQVGRSLKSDERMELPESNGQIAVLTPERRKRLVLAANAVYEQPIELTGTIVAANWEKSSFQLRQFTGEPAVVTVPMLEEFHGDAGAYGGSHRHQITVKGVGAFDSWDRLQKVVSVESLEVQIDFQLAARFDELRALEPGWHDGHGKGLERGNLDHVATKLVGHYPEKLPLPVIVPTLEGNLLFEWTTTGDPSLDLDLSTLLGAFHAFSPESGDIEEEFSLTNSQEWSKLFSFLTKYLGQIPA